MKKLLALLLSLSAAFLLPACGSDIMVNPPETDGMSETDPITSRPTLTFTSTAADGSVTEPVIEPDPEISDSQGIVYSLTESGGAYYVLGFRESVNTDIVIPAVCNGLPVVAIGENAFVSKNITSVTIPGSVRKIDASAFQMCYYLESVTISNGVTEIGAFAFSNCSMLSSITIPDSVTELGEEAFSGCYGITSITISNSLTVIPRCAFIGCSPASVTIPDSVTKIAGAAFSGWPYLTSITIPESVAEIEELAFGGCSNLVDVYYTGTKEQWEKIGIEPVGNDELTSATIHYNA